MKNNITYLIIIGLFIYIVFIQTCNSKPVDKEVIYKTIHTETKVTKIDTFIIKESKKNIPVYIVNELKDTVYITSEPIPEDLQVFYSNINDSLLNGTITVYSESRTHIDFDYELKTFEKLTTHTIKDSTIIKANKSFVSLGATLLGSSNSFGFAPVIQYNHKKGMTYNVGYDLLNNNIHIGFTKKLSFK